MTHFTIIIPSYNTEKWVNSVLNSAVKQKYENYDVIFIDACSTDRTYLIAKSFQEKYSNLTVIRNDVRKYPIENIKIATELAKPNSIIVTLDGDDWLKHENVLNILDSNYTENVWMTYGKYEEYPYHDVSNHYRAYSNHTILHNRFRDEEQFLASHLRTYRRELFLHIKEEDMKYNGEYMDMTGDMALQFPMLEMSGYHSKHISDVLYVYNKTNPISDFRIDEPRQIMLDKYIRSKPKYNKLEKL